MVKIAFIISVLALTLLPPQRGHEQAADIVFRNGNIYTANDKQPKAQAVAVKDGRFIYVGTDAGIKSYIGKDTKVIDLRGQTTLPGLTDSHYHLIGVGQRELMLNLEGTTNLQDFLAKVKLQVGKTKPGAWVYGRGWIETFWKPPVFPTRADLDSIAPNNPVFLVRADGHGAVVNSAALKIAGITKDTKDPFGGRIQKDLKTGEPSGMLLDNAQDLVEKHIPPPTMDDLEKAILVGVERSLRMGLCQIQNAGSVYHPDVELIRKLYDEGKIKLRIYNAVYGPGPNAERLMKEGPTIDAYDHRFTMRTIKVVSDGALGSRGAALLQPYSDYPTSGFMTVKDSDLVPMLEEALRTGIQVETHAIGDRANRTILDDYETALKAVPADQRKIDDPRWRMEHAQIVNPADIPRFAKLHIIPSMQASHAIGDLHFAPSRLGLDRLAGAYAWQSFIKEGLMVAGGSDAPVEQGNPMIEFYAAVARKDLKGFSGPGWHPEERLSRGQALKMLTLWPAYAAFQENEKGSIEPGKLADMTVLSADIMKVPELQIPKTHCVLTVISGEVVYDSNGN